MAEKKEDKPNYGEIAGRIREFAEKQGLDDETINDFVQHDLKEQESQEAHDPILRFLLAAGRGSGDV